MTQLKKNKYINVSIVLSIISIGLTVFINYQIAKEYAEVDGKTKGLFGLIEYLRFEYQYYVLLPAIISFLLALMRSNSNGPKNKKIAALILSVFAVTIIFFRIWRLFV